MQIRLSRLGLTLCLLLAVAAGWAAPTARAVNDDSTYVSFAQLYIGRFHTNGGIVVFDIAQQTSGGLTDIYAAPLTGGEPYPLVAGPGTEWLIGIAGDVVAYVEDSDQFFHALFTKNLRTGEIQQISSDAEMAGDVAIAGDWVTWTGHEYPVTTIYARNHRTMAAPIAFSHFDAREQPDIEMLSLDGDRVTWRESVDAENEEQSLRTLHQRLRSQRIGDAKPTTLLETTAEFSMEGDGHVITLTQISGSYLWEYEIAGETVAYSAWTVPSVATGEHVLVLNALNIATGEVTVIERAGREDHTESRWVNFENFTTDGRYVFYELAIDDHPNSSNTIRGYDLDHHSRFIAVPAARNESDSYDLSFAGSVNIEENHLLWGRAPIISDPQGRGRTEIHAASIDRLLPSAPVAEPEPVQADQRWFPESGHTLSAGFRTFWDANGALPVFGYPLTEEFTERNPDTDIEYTMQYTERQRYEFHPELAGTPYAVLLGRLGAEDAARRGITETPSFQAAPRPTDTFPCTWHDETSHGVCGSFRDYWAAHGLDLGDDGTSYRESLALFGYPISEQYFDEATGFTTQYFERAVFEWHPDNPEEYRVLLRRLGAELLVERGWRIE